MKKTTKTKIVVSIMLSLLNLIGSIYFSLFLNFIMAKQYIDIKQIKFINSIHNMTLDKKHLILFLCTFFMIEMLILLLIIARTNNVSYESPIKSITNKIKTPVASGQKQHGSAEWLEKNMFDKVFKSYVINPKDKNIKELIDKGYDDLEFYTKKKKDIKNKDGIKNKVENIRNNYTMKLNEFEKKLEEDIFIKKLLKISGYIFSNKNELKEGGILLGMSKKGKKEKIYFVDDDIHTICIGSTRSGKSRTVVLQSIALQALSGESMIMSDPKGELYQYTYPFLERLGYEVITLDFKNPLKSTRYNFLQNVIDYINSNQIPKAIEAAWDLTSSLVGEAKGERIWTDGEASVIAASILCVAAENKDKPELQNMTNVYFFISEMCKPGEKGEIPLNKYVKTLPDNHPAKGLIGISEVAPSKTRGSFFTSALTTLRLFTNPLIYSMTSTSDFNKNTTGEDKRAIFIILPDEKVTYYSLASLFVSQHYETLVDIADKRGGRLKRRVNFNLDEFGNFAVIPSFATKLTVGGGRGIRFNLFLQNFAQLSEKYGQDTPKTIKGNCQIWLYLKADDIETLEEISKKLGNYTVASVSESTSYSSGSNSSKSSSTSLNARALLTVDEVKLIDRPYTLVTSRDNPSIMKAPDLTKYYFNKMFGLGDKEHNINVRMERENRRPEREMNSEIKLWGIWKKFSSATDEDEPENDIKNDYLDLMRKDLINKLGDDC